MEQQRELNNCAIIISLQNVDAFFRLLVFSKLLKKRDVRRAPRHLNFVATRFQHLLIDAGRKGQQLKSQTSNYFGHALPSFRDVIVQITTRTNKTALQSNVIFRDGYAKVAKRDLYPPLTIDVY